MRFLSFLFLMVFSVFIISGCISTHISDSAAKHKTKKSVQPKTSKPTSPDTTKQVKKKAFSVRWQVVISWSAPKTNEDGTQITNLAGYKIYNRISPKKYRLLANIKDPTVTSYKLVNLKRRTYNFGVTAYNIFGYESNYSNIVRKSYKRKSVRSK